MSARWPSWVGVLTWCETGQVCKNQRRYATTSPTVHYVSSAASWVGVRVQYVSLSLSLSLSIYLSIYLSMYLSSSSSRTTRFLDY